MENVPAIFSGEKRLLRFPSDSITYAELERKLRDKFSVTNEDVAISVETPDGERYRVKDDEDLDTLRNQMKMLHIESSSKPFSDAVVAVGQDNQLQTVFEEENPLKSTITSLCGVVDLLQLTATAANVQGAKLHDLEKEVYDTIVSLAEICQDADVFYAKCDTSCDNVLSTVKVAAGFHADGLDDIAMKTLATLGAVSRDTGDQCKKLYKKVDTALTKIRGILRMRGRKVTEMETNLDDRKELSMSKRQQEIEISRATEALREAEAGVNERKETYSIDKKRAHDTTIAAEAAGGVSSLLSFGLAALKAGTVLSGVAAIGVPAVLLGASAFFVHACGKQVSDMNAQQLADEAMLADRRNEVAEAQKGMLHLTHKLETLESVNVEDALEVLHEVETQLKILLSVTLELKGFWEMLANTFFPRQQSVEEKFAKYSKADAAVLHRFFNSNSFKEMLEPYLKYWVVFKEHCRESQAAVKCNIKPLHVLMKRNLTADDARRMLPRSARAIREEQSADATTRGVVE